MHLDQQLMAPSRPPSPPLSSLSAFVTHLPLVVAFSTTPTPRPPTNQAPEPKLRSGSADNGDVDKCAYNWIHHNTMRSYGNECVDVKEGSSHNLIESNVCENQMDEDSGCFGLRGSDNTLRWNEIAECKGAGVRMGGNLGYGGGNHIYENVIKEAKRGAFSVMSPDQGTVCGNKLSGVDRIVS